jgi:hypothetical protein
MVDLLHEYWANEEGGAFGPVREHNDQLRPMLLPEARLVFSLHASSWHQAMRMHNERLGYGEYMPTEGVSDHFYTEEDAAEQDAYLGNRTIR